MEDVAFQSGGGSGGIVVINRSNKKQNKNRRPNSSGFGKVNRLQHAERESTVYSFVHAQAAARSHSSRSPLTSLSSGSCVASCMSMLLVLHPK